MEVATSATNQEDQMASITVRISDETRDALQAKADQEHQTLSDFIRERLQDAVFNFRETDDTKGLEPDSMSAIDRHTLSLLHRILGRVLPEGANDVDGNTDYQLERAKVLESGFTNEYATEFAGLYPELGARHCEFVKDVLDMFRITLYSFTELHKNGVEVDDQLRDALTFRGFDHNDHLEGQMSDYVRYLVENGKWEEQSEFVLGSGHGNSHSRMIDVYSRMLSEYREVKQSRPQRSGPKSYLFNKEALERLAAARIHPSNR
jgi:uncharacterized protein YfbU (UPF0304 family)